VLLIGLSWGAHRRPGVDLREAGHDRASAQTRPERMLPLPIDGTNPDSGGPVRVNRDTYQRCMEERGYVARLSAN
jgi:hypothetical protein